ncbi:hypothetical protein K469DRAFT_720279 [Zopfia rhizophila CBS 207.26]|uniref:Uncharacterized protein n=1 Tax=Zopfia rhizophila CBS 207.26 TaxID=1314779 RepID=A0A6A6EJU2_9PEZI|nr:hypothetical protein K469DRAFT_720279 [Zopfia rhizophila CBS 207.26]
MSQHICYLSPTPPLPWYYTPDKPLTYEELQTIPNIIDVRQFAIRDQIHMPLFRARDNSLCSLYRLYDDLCAHELIMMGYECEYMFRRGSKRWLVSEIPDPQDSDPIRYAILASVHHCTIVRS